jgi:ribonuclease HI
MKKCTLFTDGSVTPQTKIGYGAYLLLIDSQEILKTQRFENTSSSKLELETLLWALGDIVAARSYAITLYTDSQNIVGLDARRVKILQNPTLKNYALYQAYFQIRDTLNLTTIKVSGHLKSSLKDETDQYFTMVDKAARQALRRHNKHTNNALDVDPGHKAVAY